MANEQDVIQESEKAMADNASVEMLSKTTFSNLLTMLKSKSASDSIIFYCNQALIFTEADDILRALLPHMSFDEIAESYNIFRDGDINYELEGMLGISS